MSFSLVVLFILSLKCNGNSSIIASGCFLAKNFHMNFPCRNFMFLVRGSILRCLQNGFTLSYLVLTSIVRIERFMYLSILSKYLFGAPLHASVPYLIQGFKDELQILLRESCCWQLLIFFRISKPLFGLLINMLYMSIPTQSFINIYSKVFGCVFVFQYLVFNVYPYCFIGTTLKTMRFDFQTLIINLFVILSTEVLISSSSFL